jgi:hypothetical protein
MRTINQNPPRELVADQFRGRRLREALLEVSSKLRARPEPRVPWDDLARADREFRSLWIDRDVDLCRAALAAAELEGPAVLEETSHLVQRYFAEKLHSTLLGFSRLSAADLQAQIVELQKEVADVVTAAARAAYAPTEANCEQLRLEVMDVMTEGKDVISITSHRLAAPARLART